MVLNSNILAKGMGFRRQIIFEFISKAAIRATVIVNACSYRCSLVFKKSNFDPMIRADRNSWNSI